MLEEEDSLPSSSTSLAVSLLEAGESGDTMAGNSVKEAPVLWNRQY